MQKHTISFQNAYHGIWTAITTQTNLRIHFVITALVLFLGAFLQLAIGEFLILLLVITLVVAAEMFNTAIEFLADAVTLEHNDYIKQAKDVSAAAVLLTAFFASIIGLLIFVPKLL